MPCANPGFGSETSSLEGRRQAGREKVGDGAAGDGGASHLGHGRFVNLASRSVGSLYKLAIAALSAHRRLLTSY